MSDFRKKTFITELIKLKSVLISQNLIREPLSTSAIDF